MVYRRPHPLRFSWLPIRVRLTIAFAGVMAAVLVGTGAFVYAQFRSDLNAQVHSALLDEAGDAQTLISFGRLGALTSSGLGLAQVYDSTGHVLGSSLKLKGVRLLNVREAIRANHREIDVNRRALPVGTVAIRAVPARAPGGKPRVVAVADRLTLRDHELSNLRELLLIALPLALLLASLAGHELARAALRPVDQMRIQAERITEGQLNERLPGDEAADEIGALSRTLNAMLYRIEAAMKRERRLVSDASHELRTPLTTLRAELDLALMGERSREEIQVALESAAQEARRMSRLADDLLVLARADQGRLPLDQEPLAVENVLEAAAARSRAAASLCGREIVVEPQTYGGAAVRGDPDRIAQMLDNLVTNALRYGEGLVRLSALERANVIELHVTDEGPGFPDELVAQPFERFARAAPARSQEPGSGLGLALVKAIAEAHGGYAEMRNLPEGGADVWIALPREPAPAAVPVPAAPQSARMR